MKNNISIYIHIPFCEKKCYYCDFTSTTKFSDSLISNYIESLIVEMSLYKEQLKSYQVDTIFIGGGTPSLINGKYIIRLLSYIYKNYNISNNPEISIEVNPGSLNLEKVKLYKQGGINRLSFGLQTTNDLLLEKIGRTHTFNKFIESYELAKKVGIDNINLDLIFALPNQSLEDIEKDLNTVLNIDIDHISYYSLILEGNTLMQRWYEEGKIKFPSDVLDRQMYHYIVDKLTESGFNHYEISNFAKDGKSCRHNIAYWKIKPYIGIGVSSHSFFKGYRFYNTNNLYNYIKNLGNNNLPIIESNHISRKDEIEEYCIFGIRLIEGINKKEFKERFNREIGFYYNDILKKHIDNGLLSEDKDYIKLTKKGLDLANLVEMDFLL